MTDNYESRLRAELRALANAVPTVPEAAPAETKRHARHRTGVRSALPVGSLIAAGLVVAVAAGVLPRLAPGSTAGASSSATTPAVGGRTGSFSTTGSMVHAQTYATATLLADGRVLVTGGYDISISDTNVESDVPCAPELYSPATGRFSTTGSMVNDRAGSTATLLPDGRVLITGGLDKQATPLSSAELYDPKTGTFTLTGPMASQRAGHTATRLKDGRVLIVGGYTSAFAASSPSAEIYDPTTGKFSPAGAMVTARRWHTATLLADGRVLIAGGGIPADLSTPVADDPSGQATLPPGREELATAELYNPASGTFSATGSMKNGRWQHQATRLADGRVLLTGGRGDYPAELYDPASGTFSNTGASATTWHAATATFLANGLVLVAGGFDVRAGSVASADLYNPTTGTFTHTGSLATSRYAAAATLLADGRVLIMGGMSTSAGSYVILDSAELFDPAGAPAPSGQPSGH